MVGEVDQWGVFIPQPALKTMRQSFQLIHISLKLKDTSHDNDVREVDRCGVLNSQPLMKMIKYISLK